ncbi:MAG: MBL fold metallo-hydrolase [Armatimonadetes bacterium]|nr:MBL fold metallo-hydrolase [Armatimonadota bacterium]
MGTGTSTGVPVIACDCAVCTSPDPRNHRYRTSAWVRSEETSILIDTPPEMRLQAITYGVRQLDAILFTHSHADHIFGLDDVRRFNFIQGTPMPCYGGEETLGDLRRVFSYVFMDTQAGGGKPSLELRPVEGPFPVRELDIVPIPIFHGRLPIFGYRVGGFAYVTDVSEIPPASMDLLQSLEVLVLGALRPQPHSTHFNFEQAIEAAQRLSPRQTYFTHMTHDVDHETMNRELPSGIELGYDGLTFEVNP